MRKLSPALAVLLSVSLLPARQETLSCGTHAYKLEEEVQLHRQALKWGKKRVRRAAVPLLGERFVEGKSVRPDIGHVAILDDGDGVIVRRNSFNLNKRTLRFTPSSGATKYAYELLPEDTYDASATVTGQQVTTLRDDDTTEMALPFSFPYFGKQYSSLWLNSDGNVTFGQGDGSSVARSLGRLASGPPRIAPLFRDLDPERVRTGGGIFTGVLGSAFTITWARVPEFRDFGTGPEQSVQLRLYPDGKIETAFGDATTQDAVVGIAPGRLASATTVVSFVNAPTGSDYTGAVAERFANIEEVDVVAAAQKFYLNHDDAYDYLVFFNDLDIPADDGAVAYESTVRNSRSGYGDRMVETGEDLGSARRLQAVINMGNLSQYPNSLDEKVPARFSVGDTPLTTLAHEAGHLFLAFASARDEEDPSARPMLGGQGSVHWTFTFNSEASVMEGNRIRDNGPGASPRFLTTATVEGFSPLDQYLMGLRAPEEVPDTFYVKNARGTGIRGFPRVGVAFDGDRQDVRIDDIIKAEGRRVPDHTVSQRRFRFAFILVTAAGAQPSPEKLALLEQWRTRFEEFYSQATSGRASADTSIKNALQVSMWPAAGVIAGGTGTGTVAVARPVATPLTVLLRSSSGNARVPASVVLPAGATQATFEIAGVREGVDELMAEPADASYETVHAKVQVAAPAALRVAIVTGNNQAAAPGVALAQPVRIRVTDVNDLPYPGVPVTASLTGGGSVDVASAMTNENGVATFRWTPGAGPVNELRAEIPGGAAVVASALGKPVLAATSVVNAASFAPGLTPGGIATVFGANLSGSATSEVLVNGRAATVLYSGTRQINFLVPQTLTPGSVDLQVRTNVGSSETVSATVRPVQPGIFFDAGTGLGAILASGQVRPVGAGEVIEIYATGLGATDVAPDRHRITLARPQVRIGGSTAEVLFSGLAPGFDGLYQVNARVPAGIASGTVALSLTADGIQSNEVRLHVR